MELYVTTPQEENSKLEIKPSEEEKLIMEKLECFTNEQNVIRIGYSSIIGKYIREGVVGYQLFNQS